MRPLQMAFNQPETGRAVDSTVVTRVTEWQAERGAGALDVSPRDAAVLSAQVFRTARRAGEKASYASEVASPLSPRRSSAMSKGKQ